MYFGEIHIRCCTYKYNQACGGNACIIEVIKYTLLTLLKLGVHDSDAFSSKTFNLEGKKLIKLSMWCFSSEASGTKLDATCFIIS